MAEDQVQNRLVETLNRYEKQEKVRKSPFFFWECLTKILEQSP